MKPTDIFQIRCFPESYISTDGSSKSKPLKLRMKLSWSWWRLAFQGDSLQLDFLGIPSDSRLNLASRVLSQNRKTPTKKVALHSGAAQGSTVFLTLSLMCFKNWPLQGQHLEMFLGYFWYDRYSAYQVATPLESFGGSWCGISSLNEELLLEFSYVCMELHLILPPGFGVNPVMTSPNLWTATLWMCQWMGAWWRIFCRIM